MAGGGKNIKSVLHQPPAIWSSGFRFQKEEPFHLPRLFECSNQTGQFRVTEVYDFAQSDLDEEDVMLFDTWEEVRGQARTGRTEKNFSLE